MRRKGHIVVDRAPNLSSPAGLVDKHASRRSAERAGGTPAGKVFQNTAVARTASERSAKMFEDN